MNQSFTPREFIEKINAESTGPAFDPYEVEGLMQKQKEASAASDLLTELKSNVSEEKASNLQKQLQLDWLKDIVEGAGEDYSYESPGDFIVERVILALDKFTNLKETEITEVLINNEDCPYGAEIIKNIRQFKPENHREIALQIVNALDKPLNLEFDFEPLEEHLGDFSGIDDSVAEALLTKQYGELIVAKHLEMFKGIDHLRLANILLSPSSEGGKRALVDNYEKFKGLDDNDITIRLIEAGESVILAKNINKFNGADHVLIANKLIDNAAGSVLADNYEKFEGLDNDDIVKKLLLARDFNSSPALRDNFEKFKGLSKETADFLLENNFSPTTIADNLENFNDLDYQKMVETIIGKGGADAVARNFEKFRGVVFNDKMANYIIQNVSDGLNRIINNLHMFSELGLDTSRAIVRENHAKTLAQNIGVIGVEAKDSVVNFICDNGFGKSVAQYLSSYEGLSPETIKRIQRYTKK
jgi:hypothetical protein